MATKYLLPCTCGTQTAVDAGLAGDQVVCECGKSLEVPKLGELRKLSVASPATAPRAAWGPRQGLMAIGIIVAILCAIPGVYWWRQPTTPDYSLDAELADSAEQFEALTPARAWIVWHQQIVPLARYGIGAVQTPSSVAHAKAVERLERYQKIAFGAAGFAILFSVTVALWKKPVTH